MLLLGGSPEGIQQGEPPSELAELYCSASAEVGQIVEALPHSVAGRLPPAAAFASHLAVFAANAPLLTTLELTGLGIYLPVSAILATDAFDRHFSTLDRPPPQVWDFGQLSSLHSAVQMLRDASSNATGHAEQLLASEIQMTLEAAVNSSTIGRRTPLYYAADNGIFPSTLRAFSLLLTGRRWTSIHIETGMHVIQYIDGVKETVRLN